MKSLYLVLVFYLSQSLPVAMPKEQSSNPNGQSFTEVFEITQPRLKFAVASCYDQWRVKGHSLFKDIEKEEELDAFVWIGDFAYVSRTERPNYIKLLKNPVKLLPKLPKLAF